jgi:anti-sigma factor RsiW
MNECRELFALLSEYLDIELPPEACEQIRKHIEDCEPCVAFVESLQKSIAICRQYQPDIRPTPLSSQALADLQAAWQKTRIRAV